MTRTAMNLNIIPRRVLALIFGLLAFCAAATDCLAQNSIHLNQLGFLPNRPMLAVVTGKDATRFEVVRQGDAQVVFAGALSDTAFWKPAGESVKIADFSKIGSPSSDDALYRIRLDTGVLSAPFKISNRLYDDVLAASIKAYYFNRAGAALEATHAGQFKRPAGHPDTVVYIHDSAKSKDRPVGTVISSSKGWYDAGDYNKYIVNSGITVFTLLKALENHEAVFADLNLNIPESQNRIPDLLDEIRWNLDWMETMQDPFDGGVYHKLTTLKFTLKPGMPHSKYQKRYVVQKGTAATLDFAAVMALSARVFSKYRSVFPNASDRYKKAAIRAWRWAKAHPDVLQTSRSAVAVF